MVGIFSTITTSIYNRSSIPAKQKLKMVYADFPNRFQPLHSLEMATLLLGIPSSLGPCGSDERPNPPGTELQRVIPDIRKVSGFGPYGGDERSSPLHGGVILDMHGRDCSGGACIWLVLHLLRIAKGYT